MRVAHLFLAVLVCLVGTSLMRAAPFKPGNIAVSNSPFGDEDLFEYTPAGVLVQSINVSPANDGRGNRVDVYNPNTMAFIRTLTLPEEHRGIAVGPNGHIYTAQRDTVSRVNHYDANGVRLDFINDPGVGGFADIDLNDAGGLLIASHGGTLLITDTNLDSIRF